MQILDPISSLRDIMGVTERRAFVDREFLITVFLSDEECDHFRRSSENDESAASIWYLDWTYEKLGPRGFHAFLFGLGVSDALVDILFRLALLLEAMLLTATRTLKPWILQKRDQKNAQDHTHRIFRLERRSPVLQVSGSNKAH